MYACIYVYTYPRFIRVYIRMYACMTIVLFYSCPLRSQQEHLGRGVLNCVCVCVCVWCVSAEEQIMTWEEIGGPPPPSPSGLQPLSAYEARPYDAIAAGHIQV